MLNPYANISLITTSFIFLLVFYRIQNLPEVAGMIQRLCPDARVIMGHGQMHGDKLEQVMLNFMEGNYQYKRSWTNTKSNSINVELLSAKKYSLGQLTNSGRSRRVWIV